MPNYRHIVTECRKRLTGKAFSGDGNCRIGDDYDGDDCDDDDDEGAGKGIDSERTSDVRVAGGFQSPERSPVWKPADTRAVGRIVIRKLVIPAQAGIHPGDRPARDSP